MMTYKRLICPICKNLCKSPHYKTCGSAKDKNLFKMDVLAFNFREIPLFNKSFWETEYTKNQKSSIDFKNNFGIEYKTLIFILKFHHIHIRTLSESNNTTTIKEKYKNTCLKNFGTTNALSKDAQGYKTREQTVKTRYGCINVFQINSVKAKITETHLLKYGAKRINPYQGKTDEQLYAIALKKNLTMKENKTYGCYWSINKLESRVADALTTLGVPFEYSAQIKRYQFDFKIGNVLLEVHGDFWHANPEIYLEDSKLNFPGKNKNISAGDVWKKDAAKMELAVKNGYIYLAIWEKEINNCANLEQLLIDKLSRFLELHHQE